MRATLATFIEALKAVDETLNESQAYPDDIKFVCDAAFKAQVAWATDVLTDMNADASEADWCDAWWSDQMCSPASAAADEERARQREAHRRRVYGDGRAA